MKEIHHTLLPVCPFHSEDAHYRGHRGHSNCLTTILRTRKTQLWELLVSWTSRRHNSSFLLDLWAPRTEIWVRHNPWCLSYTHHWAVNGPLLYCVWKWRNRRAEIHQPIDIWASHRTFHLYIRSPSPVPASLQTEVTIILIFIEEILFCYVCIVKSILFRFRHFDLI